ncbi:hypothetical protein [Pseudobdellovibrio exovorus]|uniref:Uncharacterized protein n=1 Tax=Pseudobdellovibrio exovorus JSS TaxID=1184267 RepID=M4VQS9_9BACT|nr:hypothetical protein [Pseudobdellovibrio exovorus]AGH95499.1 hypothetical protein A11Q_1283 [Pseudobdellovibrio exovorus JSS]
MNWSLLFFSLLIFNTPAFAYPEFIGFGYRSCMICHESGSGGGALTDYARGVYASEIAANPFGLDEETSVGISNFLGSVELPWWVRMGLKYRSLTVERFPGSSQKQQLHYNMQNDLNLNFYGNQKRTLALINTISYLDNPLAIAPNKAIAGNERVFMKEYFLKYQFAKDWWLQAGFMDKVFGIKTANHTSVNRAQLGLGQHDQVHALQFQWARPNEDLFLQFWNGNMHLPSPDQLKGGSIFFEQKWGNSNAYGAAVLYEQKENYNQSLLEIHNKMGFGNGNALLMELGHRQEKIKLLTSTAENKTTYVFTQGNLNLTRGLFFLSGLEFSKNDSGGSALELLKWDLGFLAFPIQRLELRFSGVNQKTYNATEAAKDQWIIQSQIHLSL